MHVGNSQVVKMRYAVIAAMVVMAATGAATDSEAGERPVVATQDGRIAGFKEFSTEGKPFYSFHSIPFAKPPIGKLRLKDPVGGDGWEGVRDGSQEPPLCSQVTPETVTSSHPVYEGDEDCLYLSIFTPKPGEPEAQLPVMVFIHGGAFFYEGIRKFSPYVFLNEDVVLIFIQYRLGILGFLSTGDSVIPGNFGLKDQTMALQWIQRNVYNFGGDASRVTIFGVSAGAVSVHFHILSPHSQGLFARGIMQSGTMFGPWALGGQFKEVAQYTGKLFGCPDGGEVQSESQSNILLTCLQGVSVENLTMSLTQYYKSVFHPLLLGPRVDGDFLPAEPEVLMTQGKHSTVDIISGVNSHEGGIFAFYLYASESAKSELLNNVDKICPATLYLEHETKPVELATKIYGQYVGGVRVNLEDADIICQMFGDRLFNVPHDRAAILHAKNVGPQKKTFLYELNHRGQRSLGSRYNTDVGRHWVTHGDDLFYLFTGENTEWKPLERPEDLTLRHIMLKLWTNFAATGNPTPDDSLNIVWEAAHPDNLHHLSLTPTPTMKADYRHKVRAFWDSLPTQQNLLLHSENLIVTKDNAEPVEASKDLDHKIHFQMENKPSSSAAHSEL
ncbi:carboxylic ester hydrolase [Cherax quadricarinatus]|uniref:carboxylic ester hydrolase n=1 Tax=Cherax quadricarinatus TaxID=27406 RepID=UPI00387E620B